MISIFLDGQFILSLDNKIPKGLPILEATLKEQINGEVSLTFSVPANHPDSDQIQVGQWALVKGYDASYMAFAIVEEEAIHDVSGLVRTFFTEELGVTELNDYYIEDKRPTDTSASAALTTALQGTGWEIGTVGDFGNASTTFYFESVMSAIKKIVDVWGGEVSFRIALNPATNEIVGRYVDLVGRIGADRGKRFEYSKDLNNITRYIDKKSLKTALIGRGKGEESGDGYGRRILFTDVEWSITNGDPADKPLGQNYIEDPEAKAIWGHMDGNGNLHNAMGEYVNEEQTDPELLLQETWDALQRLKHLNTTYKMDVIDLERTANNEYQHEAVRLGDTVRVIDREFQPPIEIGARVVEIERDLLQPINTTVTIGNVIQDMSSLVERMKRDLDNKLDRDEASWMYGIIDVANHEIHSRNGYVYITDQDGILVTNRPLDNIDNPPDQAIQLKGGILGLADSLNPDGSFNFRTFMTGRYVYADQINAGSMLADRIRGGIFIVGGSVGGIGKDGQLLLMDASDEIVCQLDATARGFDNLFIGNVSGNNVVTRTIQDMTFYIDPVNGSDNNNGTSTGQAVQSFDRVLSLIPSEIDHWITIEVIGDTPPTWSEDIYISGYQGGGYLIVNFNGATLNGNIKVKSCSVTVRLIGGRINHTGSLAWGDSAPWACIHVSSCMSVLVQEMVMNANKLANAAVRFANCFGYVVDSEVYNGINSLIWATDVAQIRINGNVGNGATNGMLASNGAVIAGFGTAPVGGTNNEATSGGGEIRGSWTSFNPGTTPATPSQPGVSSWDGTGYKSWDTVYGWNSDHPTQGNPGNWGPSGTHRGLYFFNSSDIQSTLAGRSITKVRIKLQRHTSGGYYDSRPVYFWLHNNTGATGGQPSLSNSAGSLASFKTGESKWVTLPNSFGNALRDGSARGIAIYATNPSQQNYVRMARSAQLEVTYQ